jgi:hypothetical protein
MKFNLLKLLPYLIYLFLISMFQILLEEPLSIGTAHLALAPLIIALVAIYKSQVVAIWFGASAAFVVNTGAPEGAAAGMIVAALIAIGANYFKSRLNLDSLPAKVAVVSAGCLLFEIARVTFISTSDVFHIYLVDTLQSTAYTAVVAYVFFLFKDRYISYERVREVF